MSQEDDTRKRTGYAKKEIRKYGDLHRRRVRDKAEGRSALGSLKPFLGEAVEEEVARVPENFGVRWFGKSST